MKRFLPFVPVYFSLACLGVPLAGEDAAAPEKSTKKPAKEAVIAAPALTGNEAILVAARAADDIYHHHMQVLAQRLKAGEEVQRVTAIDGIALQADPESAYLLLPFLEAGSRSPAELIAATSGLGRIGSTSAVPGLKTLTTHPDAGVRAAALNALATLKQDGAADYMGRAKDSDATIRLASLTNLGTIGQAEAAPLLIAGLKKERDQVTRHMCAIGLGKLGDRSQGQALREALTDPDPVVRRYAAEALVKLDFTPAIPDLLMALEANQGSRPLLYCLKQLTKGQDFGFDPHATDLDRRAAVDRGFAWWAVHAGELDK